MLAGGGEFHQVAPGIDQRNVGADAGKRHRRTFMNFDAYAIGHEAHHARRFHPRNLFQLLFALAQGNEKNVAADISAHDFHDLRVRHVLRSRHFNLIAGVDAKTPGMLSIIVERRPGGRGYGQHRQRHRQPAQTNGRLFGKGTTPDRDALLTAQEWGFLLRLQIDETSVVERLALGSLVGKRIQLFLNRGGT